MMDINLDINVATLTIQIVATLLLFLIVAKFFAKPMKNFMAKREAFVQGTFDEAKQAKLKASATKTQLDTQLNELKTQSNQLLAEASAKAQVKADAIVADALVEAQKVMEKVEKRNERERVKMIKNAQAEIATITTKATEKLIKKEIDATVHDDLFDDFVKFVGGDHE